MFVLSLVSIYLFFFFFFQAEDGIRDVAVTGVQTCALPIWISSCAELCLAQRVADSKGPYKGIATRRPNSQTCTKLWALSNSIDTLVAVESRKLLPQFPTSS